jgi:hypothetical protein
VVAACTTSPQASQGPLCPRTPLGLGEAGWQASRGWSQTPFDQLSAPLGLQTRLRNTCAVLHTGLYFISKIQPQLKNDMNRTERFRISGDTRSQQIREAGSTPPNATLGVSSSSLSKPSPEILYFSLLF